jgi:ADP-ribose pyrophosphatase YjhB (NUDIX family)
MEAGESAEEACAREILEELGVEIEVGRLIGVYSDPNLLVEYADGNRYHVVGLSFAATIVAGQPGTSDEVLRSGFFLPEEMDSMEVMRTTRDRVTDALVGSSKTFVR